MMGNSNGSKTRDGRSVDKEAPSALKACVLRNGVGESYDDFI